MKRVNVNMKKYLICNFVVDNIEIAGKNIDPSLYWLTDAKKFACGSLKDYIIIYHYHNLFVC